jgi:ribonuclease HI
MLIACLQALQRAAMLGIQKVVLETDAVHVIQAINQLKLD